MPFMDNLSKIAKSVTDGATSAAKKSGELLEITKLNMSIQGEEDKIKDIKLELGNLVFEKYSTLTVVDTEIVEMCSKIEELLRNVETFKQKVFDLKGVKSCTGCGNEIPIEVSFCPKCGAKNTLTEATQDERKPEENHCPNCNTLIEDDALFCPSCGNNLK